MLKLKLMSVIGKDSIPEHALSSTLSSVFSHDSAPACVWAIGVSSIEMSIVGTRKR